MSTAAASAAAETSFLVCFTRLVSLTLFCHFKIWRFSRALRERKQNTPNKKKRKRFYTKFPLTTFDFKMILISFIFFLMVVNQEESTGSRPEDLRPAGVQQRVRLAQSEQSPFSSPVVADDVFFGLTHFVSTGSSASLSSGELRAGQGRPI